ncbi:hypothetical protein D3C84_596780 [compost metagenome]
MPDLQRVGDDFEAVIQHSTRVCVVMVFRSRELLYQFCEALKRAAIELGELLARQRCALPDVLKQFLATR